MIVALFVVAAWLASTAAIVFVWWRLIRRVSTRPTVEAERWLRKAGRR